MRCIFFFINAFYELTLLPIHVLGATNKAADAISRNNIAILFPGSQFNVSSCGHSPRKGRSADLAMPRLDIASLVPVVQELSAAGVAPSTKKVYGSGGRRYRSFCDQVNL